MDLYKKHGFTFVNMSLNEFKLYLAKFQNLTTEEYLRYIKSENQQDTLKLPDIDKFIEEQLGEFLIK